jgi:hypothetical protein
MKINNIIFGNCVYGNYMIKDHVRPVIVSIPISIYKCKEDILEYVINSLSIPERESDNLYIINSSITDGGLFTGDLVTVEDITSELNL